MKKLPISQLPALFAHIFQGQKLYIPADVGGVPQFALWQPGLEMTRSLNTARSAKDLFFPQVENMVNFKVTGKQIDVVESRDPGEDFVLFGVRACDCRSFDILDSVFLDAPEDTYYKPRRDHATVITLGCTEPEETCFCTAMGIDPTTPGGDASGWIAEDTLYLQAHTPKGEALLDSLPMLQAAQSDAVEAARQQLRAVLDRLPLKELPLEGFTQERMMTLFHSPKWKSLSESCLGCGSCTFVCPTCQCYDIRDFDDGRQIRRYRCWDSCMYSDFTCMSAGQPRPTQLERFRQRFMHKLVYYPANHQGVFGCVGCGRCLQKCPIHMNIVKVAKALGEEIQ